ncbi:hypothetical protein TcWFU_006950 [Taenia crassiceps]|uniref:Uncharacterized protein n=1 Tax=Taenia crassiceps TaxID=6207 RepID=A0ABR4Q7L5_9CEST
MDLSTISIATGDCNPSTSENGDIAASHCVGRTRRQVSTIVSSSFTTFRHLTSLDDYHQPLAREEEEEEEEEEEGRQGIGGEPVHRHKETVSLDGCIYLDPILLIEEAEILCNETPPTDLQLLLLMNRP